MEKEHEPGPSNFRKRTTRRGRPMMHDKNLQLERFVFFSDAVVAIAITLLALNLKVPVEGHFRFSDLWIHWKSFGAFALSFFNIANFWKTHHLAFAYIKKIDERLMWWNILWLLFIAFLPFSTTLLADYFFDPPALVVYGLNILLLTWINNTMWRYALKNSYMDPDLDPALAKRIQIFFTLDVLNSILAIIISPFNSVIAFIALLTKFPMIFFVGFYRRIKKRRGKM